MRVQATTLWPRQRRRSQAIMVDPTQMPPIQSALRPSVLTQAIWVAPVVVTQPRSTLSMATLRSVVEKRVTMLLSPRAGAQVAPPAARNVNTTHH